MNFSSQPVKLILGSKSPRRRMLISELNWPVEITEIDVEEIYPDSIPPEEIASYLSELKANHFNKTLAPDEILITADTLVLLQGKVMMKPESHQEAVQMLSDLSGKQHEVITGVTLRTSDLSHTFSDVAQVQFNELSEQEIKFYIDKYQPFDKAGSYGVQEWIGYVGIRKIIGSYFTIMGLPVDKVYRAIKCITENQKIPF